LESNKPKSLIHEGSVSNVDTLMRLLLTEAFMYDEKSKNNNVPISEEYEKFREISALMWQASRDTRAMYRILGEYYIANDAGITDTIVNTTLDRIKSILK
jgi:hypothetical protein